MFVPASKISGESKNTTCTLVSIIMFHPYFLNLFNNVLSSSRLEKAEKTAHSPHKRVLSNRDLADYMRFVTDERSHKNIHYANVRLLMAASDRKQNET